MSTTGRGIERELTELDAATDESEAREAVLQQLFEEQAALRRVATLVALGAPPTEIFAAVTNEVGALFDSHQSAVTRFDPEGPGIVIVGVSKAIEDIVPIGTRWELHDSIASARVYRTGRSARVDRADASVSDGPAADTITRLDLRSTVSSPIVVEGQLWGTMTVSSRGGSLAANTEERLEKFTELIATAIANAESRAALAQLAQEQAALRQVATLVAQDAPPEMIFRAVADEVGALFRTGLSSLVRFEGDEIIAVGSSSEDLLAVGTRYDPEAPTASREVLRTGCSARIERVDWSRITGVMGAASDRLGIVSTVASPIIVGGRAWGSLAIASTKDLPRDTEARLEQFADLVATAIANAENSAELAASRRRIVAAADEARRRIERDLHDGVQQQLVTLGMELRALRDGPSSEDALREQLAGVTDDLRAALDALVEIARGIHPAILSQGGLAPALKGLARRSPVPVELHAEIEDHLPDDVEVAAYYVAAEALTNVAKYACASLVCVDLATQDGTLTLAVRDDGVGGAELGHGSGLPGLRDRVEALGGTITIDSPSGGGTTLVAQLPVRAHPVLEAERASN